MRKFTQRNHRMPWMVDEFVEAAERIMASAPGLFVSPDTGGGRELNVRLIRDYVVRELIPRPGKSGREARFGLDHLVHLLAVRVLLRSQKWSLPAIKASLESTDTENLLGSILTPVRSRIKKEFILALKTSARNAAGENESSPSVPTLNPALQLIERFKARQPTSATPEAALNAIGTGRAQDPGGSSLKFLSGVRPTVSTMMHLRLEDWCEVVIDARKVKSLRAGEIEALGESLKRSLKKELS